MYMYAYVYIYVHIAKPAHCVKLLEHWVKSFSLSPMYVDNLIISHRRLLRCIVYLLSKQMWKPKWKKNCWNFWLCLSPANRIVCICPATLSKRGSVQGCQMVYFQTKINPNLGKNWRALELKMLVGIYILYPFAIFYSHLVKFVAIWYILWS
jgi:hypothetical protein